MTIQQSDWQRVFELSPAVCGTDNRQDMLPPNPIVFPRDTWLSRRLEQVRHERKTEMYDDSD
jgi:hypothetical protein